MDQISSPEKHKDGYLIYKFSTFHHPVYFADTSFSIEKLAKLLIDKRPTILGFDTEFLDTRVEKHKNAKRTPLLLIQLADKENAYLFHLYRSKWLSDSLKKLLSNDRIVKVGFGTWKDILIARQTFNVNINGALDLRSFLMTTDPACSSLAKFASKYTSYTKDHRNIVDWTYDLTDRLEEIKYAALDAIACLEGYLNFLKSFKLTIEEPKDGSNSWDSLELPKKRPSNAEEIISKKQKLNPTLPSSV